MKVRSRTIGSGKNAIIEVIVTNWSNSCSIMEDVTNIHGVVDDDFIFSLRELADELEEQNIKVSQSN